MKKRKLIFIGGQLCLAGSLLISRFVKESNPADFVFGLLIGISIVLNIYYVATFSKEV